MNNLVLRNLEHIDDYDYMYITDLSVTEYVAEKIQKVNDSNYTKVLLFDHHKTAEWLNKYPWACVCVETTESDNITPYKYCGALLFSRFLSFYSNIRNEDLDYYIDLVRMYDTWEWKTKYNLNLPNDLNSLYYIKGKSEFISSVLTSIRDHELLFSPLDQKLLDIENNKKLDYISKKNSDIIKINIDGYKVGVVFAEQYISELGNRLCELNPELDFVAMINQRSISYRSIKEDIDVSEFAKKYGGGGHKASSGNPLKTSQVRNLIYNLFK